MQHNIFVYSFLETVVLTLEFAWFSKDKHGLYYVMPSQNQFLSMNPALWKQTFQLNMLHYFVSLWAESSQVLLKF